MLDSVRNMLRDPNIPADGSCRIRAFCSNVLSDVPDFHCQLLDRDAVLTIGSIGRLEKPFLIPMLEKLQELFKDGRKYNLVLIGGTPFPAVIDNINRMMGEFTNVKLVITGYMYPIPISLLNSIDIFISTASSARVSYQAKRPTIRVHHETGDPTCVSGTEAYPVSTSSLVDVSLVDLLRRIVSGKLEIRYEDDSIERMNAEMNEEFARQLTLF